MSKKDQYSRNIGVAIGMFIFLVMLGTFFYTQVEHWSLLDAVYFSVVSLATVGYGDLHPTHDISRIFTMLYITFGVGLVLFIFSTISEHIMGDHDDYLAREEILMKLERIEKDIKSLKKDPA